MPAFGVLRFAGADRLRRHVVRTRRRYVSIYLVVFVPVVRMAAYFLT